MPHPYSKLSDDELIVLARSSDPGARHRRKAVCEELYARLKGRQSNDSSGVYSNVVDRG